jgi:hypothetical protein
MANSARVSSASSFACKVQGPCVLPGGVDACVDLTLYTPRTQGGRICLMVGTLELWPRGICYR